MVQLNAQMHTNQPTNQKYQINKKVKIPTIDK